MVVPEVSVERALSRGGMAGVVTGKLSQWQKVHPIFLMVAQEAPEILLQDLINPLRLAICLRVVCGREAPLNTQSFEEGRPEPGRELETPIRDHRIQEPM